MYHYCCEIFRFCSRCTARELINPYIPEAEEGKFWLVGLLSVTADIQVLGFGCSVVFRIKTAFFIQNLGMGEFNRFPGFGSKIDFYITGDILAEVSHDLSFWRGEDTDGSESFLLPGVLALLGNQGVCRAFKCTYRFGGTVIPAAAACRRAAALH